MDSAHEALIGALRSIRDQADLVLKSIEHPAEQKSLAWKCVACGYVKHFYASSSSRSGRSVSEVRRRKV